MGDNLKSTPKHVRLSSAPESMNLLGFRNNEMVFGFDTHTKIECQKYIVLQGKKFQIVNLQGAQKKEESPVVNETVEKKLEYVKKPVDNLVMMERGAVKNTPVQYFSEEKNASKSPEDSKTSLLRKTFLIEKKVKGKSVVTIFPRYQIDPSSSEIKSYPTTVIPRSKPFKPILLKSYKRPIVAPKETQLKIIKPKKLTSTSTNTDNIVKVDREIQTDDPVELSLAEFCSRFEDNESVIMGRNVNMGFDFGNVLGESTKVQFFRDLHSCLRWESENLPIHRAVLDEDLAAVKRQCILLKARKSNVNIPNKNHYTALHLAIIRRVNIDIVKVLFEESNMSILDPEGNNILHLAVENDRPDLMELFLNDDFSGELNINHFNHAGLTPLMCCAIASNRERMAKMLLDKSAGLDLRDLKSGRTALFHAAENCNLPMVTLLLRYSANTKIRNFFGTSVHDAMFELEDLPTEIKTQILGRADPPNKRKSSSAREQDDTPKKIKVVPTYQKIKGDTRFIVHQKFTNMTGQLLLRELK